MVVNNAGTTDAVTPAEHQDPGQFREVVEVDVDACFVLASTAARQMIVQEAGGSIINIASSTGWWRRPRMPRPPMPRRRAA